MKRVEIYEFVKGGVNRLKKQHGLGRGRVSEFSSQANKSYPTVWLETQEMNSALVSNSLPMDTWPIVLHIGQLDKEDSSPDQYEEIIDACDEIAQSLQFLYNSIVSGNNLLRIESISRIPFIKAHADSITGVILSFNLIGPDTTDQSENCE